MKKIFVESGYLSRPLISLLIQCRQEVRKSGGHYEKWGLCKEAILLYHNWVGPGATSDPSSTSSKFSQSFTPISHIFKNYIGTSFPVHTSCIGFQTAKKTTRFQFSIPGLPEIHRNLKQQKKFKSRESFFRKSPFCTFSCINPGFGGPWGML